MAIYYIADLHLGHENVIEFDNRPFLNVEEMNNTLISNWNSKVTNDDFVYILGDFAWAKENMWPEILSKFNGIKTLIRGNHDPKEFSKESKKYLADIKDYKEITDNGRRVIMCHYAIPFHRSAYNDNCYMLYGHVHVTRENDFLEKLKKEVMDSCSKSGDAKGNFINVGCMMPWMNYFPRTLDEIIAGEREYFKKKYD